MATSATTQHKLAAPQRAATTNTGKLPGVDRRSREARRLRDLTLMLLDALPPERPISNMTLALIRRAAALMLAVEEQEAAFLSGKPHDIERHVDLVQAMLKTLRLAGIAPRPSAASKAGPKWPRQGKTLEQIVNKHRGARGRARDDVEPMQ